jgi:hypothetical protein
LIGGTFFFSFLAKYFEFSIRTTININIYYIILIYIELQII